MRATADFFLRAPSREAIIPSAPQFSFCSSSSMLNVQCSACGAIYKLSEDLYSRKAAGFGVIVTCRRCKAEIHVEAQDPAEPPNEPGPKATLLGGAQATEPEPSPKPPVVDPTRTPAAPPWPGAPLRAEGTRKRDPVSGPFVALSPGLLGAGGPRADKAATPRTPATSDIFQDAAPDSEMSVDSRDFVGEAKRERPQPPMAKPWAPERKAPTKAGESRDPVTEPKHQTPADPALSLTRKPPRPPQRSDDFTDDLLSADVGFDAPSPMSAPLPILAAPTSSALLAPAQESSPTTASEESGMTGAAAPGDAAKERARPRPSRTVWIALLLVGALGAVALALRGKLGGSDPPPDGAQQPESTELTAPGAPVSAPESPPAAAESPTTPPPQSPSQRTSAERPPTSAQKPASTGGTKPATRAGSSPSATNAEPSGATGSPSPAATASGPAPEPATGPVGPFDAAAARAALAGAVAEASGCRKPGDPTGVAAVTITFAPSGRVTSATLGGPPFAGTATGGCIAATLRKARVPAFEGDLVTVKKTVEIR